MYFLAKHRYNHVPEHRCLAPGFCGCKGMGGQECLEQFIGVVTRK